MRKNFILLLTLLFVVMFVGCAKTDKDVSEAKSAVEKYITAINEKDEATLATLVDTQKSTYIVTKDISAIKLKSIKHFPGFNSEETPKEQFAAFDIIYEVKDNAGNVSEVKKWVSLEKIDGVWMITSVGKG